MKVRSRLERIVCPEKGTFMIRKNRKGATDTVIKTTDGRLRLGKKELLLLLLSRFSRVQLCETP